MSILNAYYFPGGRYEGLYEAISPVNSFRVVLNTFFGAKLPTAARPELLLDLDGSVPVHRRDRRRAIGRSRPGAPARPESEPNPDDS